MSSQPKPEEQGSDITQGNAPLVFTTWREGKETGQKEFNQKSILIGRGDAANLRIDDPKASKLHAVIDITSDEVIHLLDLGSTNGTKVNGEKVHRVQIKAGDEIQVGHTVIKFARRELSAMEEKSVEAFQATFDAYFNEVPLQGEEQLRGKERRKVIEVAQIWGDSIVQMTHFMRPDRITIGPTEDCNFFAPKDYLPFEPFALVVNQGRDYYLQYTELFGGQLEEPGGKTTSLQQLIQSGAAKKRREKGTDIYRFQIDPGARLRVEIGSLSFLIQRVRPAKVIPTDFLKQLDYLFLSVMGVTLASFVGILLLVGLITWLLVLLKLFKPPSNDDLIKTDDIVASLLVQPEKVPDIPIPKVKDKKPSGNPDAGEGDKARGDEGKRGKADSKIENTRGGAFKAPTDKDIVDGAGVLGAMKAENADLNAIFGSGTVAGGANDNIGGLFGSTTADQHGSGGLGLKGNGKGGGGNSLSIGGLGTHGRGTGATGHGSGAGVFGKGKGDASIGIGGEETVIMGSLDPAIIDAVIKRHLPQIQYCYERELARNPKLAGKIVIHFTIEADGRVSAAQPKSSSMGDSSVDSCISQRFLTILFPKPKGGGIVTVNYPFLFKGAGE